MPAAQRAITGAQPSLAPAPAPGSSPPRTFGQMADWMVSSPIRIALLQAEQREAGGSPFTVRESMEYEADGSALEAPGPIVEK